MEHAQALGPDARAHLASAVTELVQSTSRTLMLAIGGAYLAACFTAAAVAPQSLHPGFLWLAALVLTTGILSLWLLSHRLILAHLVWQVGLAAGIALALRASGRPEVVFAFALLPLLSAVTVGWPAALVAELVLAWLVLSPAASGVPMAYAVATLVGGAFAGFLGWAVTHALLTTVQWCLQYYEEARQKVEEAREQRLELKQVQEDLIHANRELARLSDRLKAMHQVAEEARRAKEEFVANVSHELRTPLNMIIGFSEMITQAPQVYGDRLPPALLSDITAIQRNSLHLSRLVDDVLDLSQVEAGRMALSRAWVSLSEIIAEAVQVVQPLFAAKGLSLQVEVAPDLPPLLCDSTRIRQVVINLLSNAGRFTEQGGVRVRACRQGQEVVVSVADTGPGIAPEDQKRIFQPFQQLDTSLRRRHGGSGLGLSISKRFVEMHEGRMWLESQVGAGTTFYFSLPLEPPVAAGHEAAVRRWFSPYHQYEARTRRSKAPVPSLGPRLVLLEPGDRLLRMFSRYLNDVEVVAVRDLEAATRELARSPAQALVVNTPPPLEPLVRQRFADLPYATPAVTCWVPGEDEAARRLGVVRYLVKPVTRDTLIATLADLGDHVRTVLLVDDEPEALQLFTRMLSSAAHPYDVVQARSGGRALSLLRRRRPDVMLLDLVMPGMDGFQVLQEKSRDPAIREVPVVVISSRDPTGEPLVGDTLTVTRGGGLSARQLLGCIRAISQVLAPDGRERRATDE